MEGDETESVFHHVPYEILVEILLRLPAPSLMKFKSVSKQFCALFSSPKFIKGHLEISRDRKQLIKYGYICAHNLRTLKLFSLESLLNDRITHYGTKLNDSYLEIDSDACMMESCDGLICFFKKPNHLWIWNPATRKYRKLPTLTPAKPGSLEFIGFGYYEPAKDYKVVAIQCPDDHDYAAAFSSLQVYSLNTNRWETLLKYQSRFLMPHSDTIFGVFLNNKPYWLEDPEAEGICHFDLATSKLAGIKMPHEGDFALDYLRRLDVLDGCLCIGIDKESSLDLWLIKGNILMKYVSVKYPNVLDLLHVSKKDGILTMVQDKYRKRWLMLYDSSKVSSPRRMLVIPTHVEVQIKTLVYIDSMIPL